MVLIIASCSRSAAAPVAGPSGSQTTATPSSSQTYTHVLPSSQQSTTIGSSQPGPSSQATMSSSQVINLADSEDEYDVPDFEEIPKDDHYVDLKTAIVGIQYYKGVSYRRTALNATSAESTPYGLGLSQVS